MKTEQTEKWEKAFKFLEGAKVVKVDYMTSKVAEKYGWDNRPIQIHLDNGGTLIPQRDDEGNDAGALWVGLEVGGKDRSLAPVLSVSD